MKYIWMVVVLVVGPSLSLAQTSNRWQITRPEWTFQDEARFGEFVARIGEAVAKRQCFSVRGCMRSSANPYAKTDPSGLNLFADCADLPYFLRTYFAWKNGLPMSVEKSVRPRSGSDNSDIRYTKYGNYVTSRYDILSGYNAVTMLNSTVINTTSSASFRVRGSEDRGNFDDFYPVKLNREGIRPGTVIYDPNGHVTIVFKTTADGRIYYIDAHPDNSMTSGMYTPKFVRSFPYQGAGFKNFRPLTLVDASADWGGVYQGGRIVGARNSSLPAYSLEQFYGNKPDPNGDWQKGQFVFNGKALNYYEYVRVMMAGGNLKLDPLKDMQALLADICVSIRDRVVAVEAAREAGIDDQPHPYRLPYNIYGTEGEWEEFSSPSRDARLKVSYMDVLAQSKTVISRWRQGDPSIVYSGTNLAADLLKTYIAEAKACQISYTTSNRSIVKLDLDEVRRRLFDLSFDPYHCIELRWGAKTSQELSSCRDGSNKREWYSRERWLRYQWERRYDARMDYSLEELTGPKPGAGIANPPDVDIVSYLNSQK